MAERRTFNPLGQGSTPWRPTVVSAVGLDGSVLQWFVEHREPWLTTAVRIVTDVGSSAFLIPLVLAVGAWYWRRHGTRRPLTLLALAYCGSFLVSQSIKALAARARPPDGLAVEHFGGYAFPSGHATEAAAVYGMLAFVLASRTPRLRRKASAWACAVVIVAVVGITRLYLGAHWLTDVLGGWLFGSLWFLAVVAASHAVSRRGRGLSRDLNAT